MKFNKSLFCLIFLAVLSACGTDEEKHLYSATSENWQAKMEVVIKGTTDEFDIHLEYKYTGDEQDFNQEVLYDNYFESYGRNASMIFTSDTLPAEEKFETSLLGINVPKGYEEAGDKWITFIMWKEDGEEVGEELIFVEEN